MIAAMWARYIERTVASSGDSGGATHAAKSNHAQVNKLAEKEKEAMPAVERTGTWQIRYWCPFGETHNGLDLGSQCPWEHCGSPAVDRKGYHDLRKRRMLICGECKQGYFNKTEFDEHACYSAY